MLRIILKSSYRQLKSFATRIRKYVAELPALDFSSCLRTKLLRIAVSDKEGDANVLSNLCRASMTLVMLPRPLLLRALLLRPLSLESCQIHHSIDSQGSRWRWRSSWCPDQTGSEATVQRPPECHSKAVTANPCCASFLLDSAPNWLLLVSEES